MSKKNKAKTKRGKVKLIVNGVTVVNIPAPKVEKRGNVTHFDFT